MSSAQKNISRYVVPGVRCRLGEGLFVADGLVAWLDIESSELYCLQGDTDEVRTIALPVQATAIVDSSGDSLTVCSSQGLGEINLATGVHTNLVEFGGEQVPASHRTNDACRMSNGSYLFGTMHRTRPIRETGALFGLNSELEITLLDNEIRIPNTFIEVDDGSVLVSDSAAGTVYRYRLDSSGSVAEKTRWYQAEEGVAPDGGCRLSNGYIAIAMWDAACVRIFDQQARLRHTIALQSKRPTNCKCDARDHALWITSATEGLSAADIEAYPDSGCTVRVSGSDVAVC